MNEVLLQSRGGKATAEAKRLFYFPCFKGVLEGYGSGLCEDILDRLVEYIPESYDSVGIKAAGNYRAVRKNAHLIAQTVAGVAVGADLGILVGPIKSIAPFEKNSVREPVAVAAYLPFLGEIFSHNREDSVVFAILTPDVP